MGILDDFLGTDWGVTPQWGISTISPAGGAMERYHAHLLEMVEKKEWPPDMVAALIEWSRDVANESETPHDFWVSIISGEAEMMNEEGVDPNQLAKIDSHIDMLGAWAEAEGAILEVREKYGLKGFLKGAIEDTTKDTKWLYVAGAIVLVAVLVRR